MNWVVVHTLGNRNDAQLTVSLLESCGIEAMVNGDDLGGQKDFLGFTFGIKVLVPESRREEAIAILTAPFSVPPDLQDENEFDEKVVSNKFVPSRKVKFLLNLTRISWSIVFVFFIYGSWHGSPDVDRWEFYRVLVFIGILPTVIAVEYLRQREKERKLWRKNLH